MNRLLKFITCGSVDDGKSTLIGHMLYDAKLIFADQKQALELDSKVGSNDGALDYSLLLDGLMAEREQGITIDVAYRFFSTEKRSFIVADTPGHEEYTRNMAVGASFAELAIILVDASQGVLEQTKRHVRICSFMGISDFVFAINKMDLVQYDQAVYEQIRTDLEQLLGGCPVSSVAYIPVSATVGDNITTKSLQTGWYHGKPLLTYLEDIEIELKEEDQFYLPIQRVCRPNQEFRGFQGQISGGDVKVGDEIIVMPSEQKAHVKEIFLMDKQVTEASQGMAVTVSLDREIDISRGCVLTKDETLKTSNLFKAEILWMDEDALLPDREYNIRIATDTGIAMINCIDFKIDIQTGNHLSTKDLQKNEMAQVEVYLSKKMVLSAFADNQKLGRFVLINRVTNQTAACGVILHTMRRADNVYWQNLDVTRDVRAEKLHQMPKTLWFTGLSGSGKSTIVNALEKTLIHEGYHTMILDGDNVRLGLNRDLGFEERDRIENIRRVAEVAKLMNDAGLIVLVSFISPYERDRMKAKEIIGDAFAEVYISTPLEECERRDVKGLYKKARAGLIPNFTGISSTYEPPAEPDLQIDTQTTSIEQAVALLLNHFFKEN